jgi:hypothetical protein
VGTLPPAVGRRGLACLILFYCSIDCGPLAPGCLAEGRAGQVEGDGSVVRRAAGGRNDVLGGEVWARFGPGAGPERGP